MIRWLNHRIDLEIVKNFIIINRILILINLNMNNYINKLIIVV
jgi:hypothetical protein